MRKNAHDAQQIDTLKQYKKSYLKFTVPYINNPYAIYTLTIIILTYYKIKNDFRGKFCLALDVFLKLSNTKYSLKIVCN